MSSFVTTNFSPLSSIIRRRTYSLTILSSPLYVRPRKSKQLHLSASLSHLTWLAPHAHDNDYNGWAIVESSPQNKDKKALPTVVIGGVVGSSLALLLAAVAYFSISRKGFTFQFTSPLSALHETLNWNKNEVGERQTLDPCRAVDSGVSSSECLSDGSSYTVASGAVDKIERIIVSVAVDSTQQEALSVLRKLKIVEDDVKADQLCTRREYARWLVRINSLLERNPKRRIVPSALLSGSLVAAFDDVDIEDPDFHSIQALAEAGIIPSKLSVKSGDDGSKGPDRTYFYPDRFISRQDLINWKAQLEYELEKDIVEQICRTKVSYLDVKDISSDASVELFMDMLAGEKSIVGRVFGQSKRFQPNKPSTKAQAAVALTSGRMEGAISVELSRLEAEWVSRQAEKEEIRNELLDRGDIRRYWVEKFVEERTRGLEVDKLYVAAQHELEQELIAKERNYAEILKEKAAMDCQRQLLSSLKEEVNEMSERLASERDIYVAEKSEVKDVLGDLQTKQEKLIDSRSILEAEIRATRELRTWVEDEARRSEARARVLEEVSRRWKWDNRAGMS